MQNIIHTITYRPEEIYVNPREVLRYIGYTKDGMIREEIERAEKVIEESRKYYEAKACYGRFPLEIQDEETIIMPYGKIKSKNLAKNLWGCSEIYIFAATIGVAFERGLKIANLSSQAQGVLFNSCGATAVEEVCDMLNDKLGKEAENNNEKLHPRFSPGYGDMELWNQRGIFDVINPPKHIGVALRDTLIMTPEKSVTAVIGIEKI